MLENTSLDTIVYNNFHQAVWDMSLGWDNNSGSFIFVPGSVENIYYYQHFTSDVAGVSNNTNNVKIFPSPARDNITIHANFQTPEAFKVQIYDMQGRLVLQLREKETKDYIRNIPLHELSSGNYILQITGSETKTQEQFSVIK